MARSTRFAARPFAFSRPTTRRKKTTRLSPRRKIQRLNLESLEDRWLLAANVFTNQLDYAPGDTAHIFASDFAIGETVRFQVLHTDGVPNTGGGHEPWLVTDGLQGDFDGDGTIEGDLDGVADGSIHTTWYVNPDDSANSAFELSAKGLSSSLLARHAFTDSVATAINIEKLVGGSDADTPPGPILSVGSTALITYVVTNAGTAPLANVVVVDDNGTPGVPIDDFSPLFTGGDANSSGLLEPVETWIYTDSRTVTSGQHVNVATATGENGIETAIDTDSAHLFGKTAPQFLTLSITSPINENDLAMLEGTYMHDGVLSSHQLDIDWDGDGIYDETVTVSGGSFSVCRQFLDDNPTGTASDTHLVNVRLREDPEVVILFGGQTISVRCSELDVLLQIALEANDLDGVDSIIAAMADCLALMPNGPGSDSDCLNLTVKNVAPEILTLSITTPINENDTATLSGTYTDVGTLDTHQLDIDWDGNGTYDQTLAVMGGSFSIDHQFLDDNPTGTPSDTHGVKVRLRDDDWPTTVTIVRPGSFGTELIVVEPNALAGHLQAATLLEDFAALNSITDAIAISFPPGFDIETVDLTVDNIAPEILTLAITTPINEGDTATLSGTYTDIGTLDTHQLDVDWDGDGDFDQTIMVTGGSFSIGHQFLDDNPTGTTSDTFEVNVRLRDDDTGSDTGSVTLTVNNLAPEILTLAITSPINENDTATLSGTYTDAGTLDTHELDIDWDGDGDFDQTITVTGGSFSVSQQFLDDNPTGTPSDTHNVGVRLRDDDGGSDTDNVSLTVNNVAPEILTLSITTPIYVGDTATLSGTYTDIGTLDTHELDIDWDGNGTYDQTIVVTGGSFSVEHQYLSPGNFTVTTRLRDDDTGSDTASVAIEVRTRQIIVIAPDKGNTSTPLVKIVNKETGEILSQFCAYEGNFLGGVQVATGDLTGDGIDEIITAPGQGRVGEVRVFTQRGVELMQFRVLAYGNKYMGGVEVAVGDVNGDGTTDIVTATKYGRPDIRVFYNYLNTAIATWPSQQFYAFSKKFLGGADLAVADVGTFYNGVTVNANVPDGKAELIVGNGPGMRSTIYVYDVSTTPKIIDTILPFSNSFKGGITLSTARVNGDAIPDIIVAAGNTGGSAIEIWSGLVNDPVDVRLSAFTAFGDQLTRNMPVHATAIDIDLDGIADLLAVVQGTNGKSNQIRCFTTSGSLMSIRNGFVGPWNIATVTGIDVNHVVDGFDIELRMPDLSPSVQAVVEQAATRWEQIIIGDLPAADYQGRFVDDLLIDISAVAIPNINFLAVADADALREGSHLPYHGYVQINTAHLASLESSGQLLDVILHEMGHVLGIGTIWDELSLLTGAGTNNPRFIGAQATAAYNQIFGKTAMGVPVHNMGEGSRDSHWLESELDNELMTAQAELPGIDTPLSRITVASLADLGYCVDLAAADPYSKPYSVTTPLVQPSNGSVTGATNVDRSLPRETLDDVAAKDDVYTEIGTEITTRKKAKTAKKAAKNKDHGYTEVGTDTTLETMTKAAKKAAKKRR